MAEPEAVDAAGPGGSGHSGSAVGTRRWMVAAAIAPVGTALAGLGLALWISDGAAVSGLGVTMVVLGVALVLAVGRWVASTVVRLEHDLLGANRALGERLVEESDQAEVLAAAFQSSNDPMLTASLDGVITGWNQAATSLYGYAADEVLGARLEMLAPPDRQAGIHDIVEQARRGGTVESLATEAAAKDGRVIPVDLGVSPVLTPDRRLVGLSLVARDLTEAMAEAERFRSIVDAFPGAVIVVDGDGRITMANPGATAMFGYRVEDMVGRSVELLVPDRLRDRHIGDRTAYQQAPVDREMGAGQDLRGRRADGSEFPVEIGLTTVEIGGVTSVLAVVFDVTARKASEEALARYQAELKRSEERFRSIVDAFPGAVIVVDGDGRITMANPGAASMFRYRVDQLVGRSVEQLVPDRLRPQHVADRTEFQREPTDREMGAGRDLRGRRADGSEFPVEIGLTTVEISGVTSVLAVVFDVTARKASEEAISRYQAELERSNEELQHFAYVASHDLQEPLRMVVSYTELLSERYGPELDDRAHKYIDYAVDGGRRMQQLIRDLLTYSRVGTQGQRPARVNVREVFDDVTATMARAIADAGGTVTCDALPEVMVDRTQLGQVLQNLLSNALKFRTPDVEPRVHVSSAPAGAEILFTVADNGIGIDATQADRIFQMFQRLHDRSTYDGSGMGLAIVRRIIERHGGRVGFESKANTGSTFWFTLPVAEHHMSGLSVDTAQPEATVR